MSGRDPAPLSEALLACKGSATVLGFRTPDNDFQERNGTSRPASSMPLWGVSVAVLMLAAALVFDHFAAPRNLEIVAAEPESRIIAALGRLDNGVDDDRAAAPEVMSVPPPPPPMAKPAAPKFRVQLHALRSEVSATREWIKLRISHRDLFGGLGMTIVRADPGPDGVRLARLQAGPFDGFKAANQLCKQAKKRRLACVVVKP